MFRGEFERRGLAPEGLSRAVEDSATVTSVLVPTAAYFPYCFFNLASPLLDVVFGAGP